MMMEAAALLALLVLACLVVMRGRRTATGWDLKSPLVIDGDTLWHDGTKIRLHGIDAPEMDQRGGPEAKRHLELLIRAGAVRAEILDTDRYGRSVARLRSRKGDLCRLMVANGYALAAYHDDYRSDEAAARRYRRGLWKRHGIDSPAQHRRRMASR